MRKLKEAIKSLEYEELRKVEEDLQKGGAELKKMLWERMQEVHNNAKFCTVCFTEFDRRDYTYSMLFGPQDFKRRAHFCAVDCMEYFIAHLKEMKDVKETKDDKGMKEKSEVNVEKDELKRME